MQLTQIYGFNPAGGNGSIYSAEKVEVMYKAGGAITVGAPVMIDVSDTTGKTVVVGASAAKSRLMVGVYEGKGGTGAATTVSGLSGNAAVTGDIILVTVHGLCSVIATPKAGSDLSTSGKTLALWTTAGAAEGYETPTVQMSTFLVSLEVGATTAGSTSVIKAYARFV